MSLFGKRDNSTEIHGDGKATVTDIWALYEKGKQHHEQTRLYGKTEQAFNFFEGDQWNGLESDEALPVMNIIQPLVEYKSAMVSMNNVSINFSPLRAGDDTELQISELLNEHAAAEWERHKMDDLCWEVVENACVSGDSYIYFYNGSADAQILDRTQVYLSDEQNPDIQRQKYILIAERRFVSDIKREAAENSISPEDIEFILPDDETENFAPEEEEIKTDDGKALSILKLWKKDGIVHYARATKTVVYRKATPVDGLKLYPIASLIWGKKRFSARGIGEVLPLIPNQIEINRGLARRAIAVKLTAFPKLVVNTGNIENPNELDKVGVAIKLKDASARNINDIVSYLAPAHISADAKVLTDELTSKTRELAGAGDAALGQVNPENASGSAIMAVRDQAALPLNRNISAFRQFVEDVASIWFNLWTAYNPNGLEVAKKDEAGNTYTTVIPPEVLADMRVKLRIDISNNTPFSKFAKEQALEGALAAGHIAFEEYVEALDSNANAPKGKFEQILQKRPPQIGAGGIMPGAGGGIVQGADSAGDLVQYDNFGGIPPNYTTQE